MGQTIKDLEVVVVDNSGNQAVENARSLGIKVKVLEMPSNVGFGAAVNAGFAGSRAPYLATINDDALADPRWLEHLLQVMESDSTLGFCASAVMFAGQNILDSAGMVIAADGSSKQRGHGLPRSTFAGNEPVLMPSGSAAIYRRQMIEQTGGFDDDFFLYCEDTDLGLRARWAGWTCCYVAEALVEHRYSHSAGRASALKAYLVERNRLRLIVKNFPTRELLAAPFATATRYFWHLRDLVSGQGKAREFRDSGNSGFQLAWLAIKAHFAIVPALPRLIQQRAEIRRTARISPEEFRALLKRHCISLRQVAAL